MKEILKRLKLSESTISMILGALVIVVIGTLIFNYFRSGRALKIGIFPTPPEKIETQEESEIPTPSELPVVYQVQAGESLWKIALKIYGSGYNWVDIAKENKLKNPGHLLVRQSINLPKVEPRYPKTAVTLGASISGDSYTVVKGDNLWVIAVRAYGDGYKWVEIAWENKLAHPNLIHPGNILRLPR